MKSLEGNMKLKKMKLVVAILVAVLSLSAVSVGLVGIFSNKAETTKAASSEPGYSESGTTVTITSAVGLSILRTYVNIYGRTYSGYTINLNNDIDLGELPFDTWEPIGTETTPFSGTFYGNDNIIYNYKSSDVEYPGLFGYVADARIKDLCIVCEASAGGLVGYAEGISISNCLVDGYIEATGNATYVGGIVGHAVSGNTYGVSIYYCQNMANIQTTYVTDPSKTLYIGGIVAYIPSTIIYIEGCYNQGTLIGGTCVGGIIGVIMQDGDDYRTNYVRGCVASGQVSPWVDYTKYAGTFIGYDWVFHAVTLAGWEDNAYLYNGLLAAGYYNAQTSSSINSYEGYYYCDTKIVYDANSNYISVICDLLTSEYYSYTTYYTYNTYNKGLPYLKSFNAEKIFNTTITTTKISDYSESGTTVTISSAVGLDLFRTYVNIYNNNYNNYKIYLTADIDLSDLPYDSWMPIGTSTTYFCGSFYGGQAGDDSGAIIYNFKASKVSYAGLFGYIGSSYIKGLCLVCDDSPGGLVGCAIGNVICIVNCLVTGSIVATSDSLSETDYLGGIVSYMTGAECYIQYCQNNAIIDTSSITASEKIGVIVGGIAGYLEANGGNIYLDYCYNQGYIEDGFGKTSSRVGGIAGEIMGSEADDGEDYYVLATNCVSYGKVHSDGWTGALVGYEDDIYSADDTYGLSVQASGWGTNYYVKWDNDASWKEQIYAAGFAGGQTVGSYYFCLDYYEVNYASGPSDYYYYAYPIEDDIDSTVISYMTGNEFFTYDENGVINGGLPYLKSFVRTVAFQVSEDSKDATGYYGTITNSNSKTSGEDNSYFTLDVLPGQYFKIVDQNIYATKPDYSFTVDSSSTNTALETFLNNLSKSTVQACANAKSATQIDSIIYEYTFLNWSTESQSFSSGETICLLPNLTIEANFSKSIDDTTYEIQIGADGELDFADYDEDSFKYYHDTTSDNDSLAYGYYYYGITVPYGTVVSYAYSYNTTSGVGTITLTFKDSSGTTLFTVTYADSNVGANSIINADYYLGLLNGKNPSSWTGTLNTSKTSLTLNGVTDGYTFCMGFEPITTYFLFYSSDEDAKFNVYDDSGKLLYEEVNSVELELACSVGDYGYYVSWSTDEDDNLTIGGYTIEPESTDRFTFDYYQENGSDETSFSKNSDGNLRVDSWNEYVLNFTENFVDVYVSTEVDMETDEDYLPSVFYSGSCTVGNTGAIWVPRGYTLAYDSSYQRFVIKEENGMLYPESNGYKFVEWRIWNYDTSAWETLDDSTLLDDNDEDSTLFENSEATLTSSGFGKYMSSYSVKIQAYFKVLKFEVSFSTNADDISTSSDDFTIGYYSGSYDAKKSLTEVTSFNAVTISGGISNETDETTSENYISYLGLNVDTNQTYTVQTYTAVMVSCPVGYKFVEWQVYNNSYGEWITYSGQNIFEKYWIDSSTDYDGLIRIRAYFELITYTVQFTTETEGCEITIDNTTSVSKIDGGYAISGIVAGTQIYYEGNNIVLKYEAADYTYKISFKTPVYCTFDGWEIYNTINGGYVSLDSYLEGTLPLTYCTVEVDGKEYVYIKLKASYVTYYANMEYIDTDGDYHTLKTTTLSDNTFSFDYTTEDVDFSNYSLSTSVIGDRDFIGWIVGPFNADGEYTGDATITASIDNGILTVTKSDGTINWIFTLESSSYTYVVKNEDYYYYVTALNTGSYGNLSDYDKILTAKFSSGYTLTITNSGGELWQNETSVNSTYSYSGVIVGGSWGESLSIKISSDATTSDNDGRSEFFQSVFTIATETEPISCAFEDYNSIRVNNYTIDVNGYSYAIYSYGYEITGYKITFTYNGTTYYCTFDGSSWGSVEYTNETDVVTIDLTNLVDNGATMSGLAGYLDTLNSQQISVTMEPVWEAVTIRVKCYDEEGIEIGESYIVFNGDYDLSSLAGESEGQTLAYFQHDYYIVYFAITAKWNYCNSYIYSYEKDNLGEYYYFVNVKAMYLDNIYKVILNGIAEDSGTTAYLGDYVLATDESTFTAESYTFEDLFECESYSKWLSAGGDGFSSSYMSYLFKDGYINKYRSLIRGSASDYTDTPLRKVFWSENEGVISAYIYLANNQATGTLPSFDNDNLTLIFWVNSNSNENGVLYIAALYDSANTFHTDYYDKLSATYGADSSEWTIGNGYNLYACYVIESYDVTITTNNTASSTVRASGEVEEKSSITVELYKGTQVTINGQNITFTYEPTTTADSLTNIDVTGYTKTYVTSNAVYLDFAGWKIYSVEANEDVELTSGIFLRGDYVSNATVKITAYYNYVTYYADMEYADTDGNYSTYGATEDYPHTFEFNYATEGVNFSDYNLSSENSDNRTFSGWVIGPFNANNSYTPYVKGVYTLYKDEDNGSVITASVDNGSLIVTKSDGTINWIFTLDSSRASYSYVDADGYYYYYVTALQTKSYGDLSAYDKILTAKFDYGYSLNINNSGGELWQNETSVNSTYTYSGVVANGSAGTSGKIAINKDSGGDFCNNVGYAFYTSSDLDGEGIHVTVGGGSYYIYSYGYRITGYKITFTYGETTYYFTFTQSEGVWSWESVEYTNETDVVTIDLTDLETGSATLSQLAEYLDSFILRNGYQEDISITLEPVWETVDLTLNILTNAGSSIYATKEITYDDVEGYDISDSAQGNKGQSLAYYLVCKNTEDEYETGSNKVAISGNWNYYSITYSYFTYSENKYKLALVPQYLDNIYKINLNGVASDSYISDGCLGDDYVKSDLGFSADSYNFTSSELTTVGYTNYSTGWIEDYISLCLETYMEDYNKLITEPSSDDNSNPLRKVFWSENEGVISAYIYLANNQATGTLPSFYNDNLTLIFWVNSNSNENGVLYIAALYDSIYEECITGYTESSDWTLDNGCNLYAFYVVESYEVQFATNNTTECLVNNKTSVTLTLYKGTKVEINGQTITFTYEPTTTANSLTNVKLEGYEQTVTTSSSGYVTFDCWRISRYANGSTYIVELKEEIYSAGVPFGDIYLDEDNIIKITAYYNYETYTGELEYQSLDGSYVTAYTFEFDYVTEVQIDDYTLTTAQIGSERTFRGWVVGPFTYENGVYTLSGYSTITASLSEEILTISNTGGTINWIFALDSSRASSSYAYVDASGNYYFYVSALNTGSYGDLSDYDKILTAKFVYNFDLTISNAGGSVWQNETSVNSTYTYSGVVVDENVGTSGKITINEEISGGEFYDNTVGYAFYTSSQVNSSSGGKIAVGSSYYYIYSYGYSITGYTIYYTKNGGQAKTYLTYSDSSWSEKTSETSTSISNLNETTMSALAKYLNTLIQSEYSEIEITMMPSWSAAKIKITESTTKNTRTLSYGGRYDLTGSFASTRTGQTLAYYTTSSSKMIAFYGTWNYYGIASSEFEYSSSGKNYGLELTAQYLDDIIKVSLSGLSSTTNFTDADYLGDYVKSDLGFSADSYNFTSSELTTVGYTNYSTGWIEDYISSNLKTYLNNYKELITNPSSDDNSNPLRKIYSTSTTDLYIYLANNQATGKLPSFSTSYFTLILWQGLDGTDADGNTHVYTTIAYDTDTHSSQIEDSWIVSDGKEGTGTWSTDDTLLRSEISTTTYTLTAFYYRISYDLTFNIVEDGVSGQYGYIWLEIDDVYIATYGETAIAGNISDETARYLIVYNTANESIVYYNLTDTGITNLPEGGLDSISAYIVKAEGLTADRITLYLGCSVTMYTNDQNNASTSMASGNYDEMIGHRYLSYESNLFSSKFVDTENSKKTSMSESDIEALGITDRSTLTTTVSYEKIPYSFTIAMTKIPTVSTDENHGTFTVSYPNGTSKVAQYSLTLTGATALQVGDSISITYNALTGYEFQNNAFVLVLYDGNSVVLMTYELTDDEINQTYTLKLTGAWLRTNYYNASSEYSGYDTADTDLGTVQVMTQAMELTYAIKFYNSTTDEFLDAEYLVGTWTIAEKTISLEKLFNLDDENGYVCELENGYILEIDGVKYAIYASYVYQVLYPTRTNSHYTGYSFPLDKNDEKISATYEITTSVLASMLNTKANSIVLKADRYMYMTVSVREIYSIDVEIAVTENDSNSSTRITTISNKASANTTANEKSITLTSGAASLDGVYTITQTLYTYAGLGNSITSTYDSLRYAGVSYNIIYSDDGNENELSGTSFEVSQNAKIIVRFEAKELEVNVNYYLDGDETTYSEISEILTVTAPKIMSGATKIYIGEKIGMTYALNNSRYSLNIEVNGATMSLTGSLEYTVSDSDYDLGGVNINIYLTENANGVIILKYVVYNSETSMSTDSIGTMNVTVKSNTKSETTSLIGSAQIKVYVGESVVINTLLNTGYTYYGYQFGTGSITTGGTGTNIEIISSFSDSLSGYYQIYVTKDIYTAQLDLESDTLKIYTLSSENSTVTGGIGSSTIGLDNLYVGKTLTITRDESNAKSETVVSYYYIDKDNNKVKFDGNKLTITSDILANISGTVIYFGVEVTKNYKVVIDITGFTSLVEYSVKRISDENPDGEEISITDAYGEAVYFESGTVLTIEITSKEQDKYLLVITGSTGSYTQTIDEEKSSFILEELSLTSDILLKVSGVYPRPYEVNISEIEVVVGLNATSVTYTGDELDKLDTTAIVTSEGTAYLKAGKITVALTTQIDDSTNGINENVSLTEITLCQNDLSETLKVTLTYDGTNASIGEITYGEQTLEIDADGKVLLEGALYVITLESTGITISYTMLNDVEISLEYTAIKSITG